MPPVTLVSPVSWQLLVAHPAAEGPKGFSTDWGERDTPGVPPAHSPLSLTREKQWLLSLEQEGGHGDTPGAATLL